MDISHLYGIEKTELHQMTEFLEQELSSKMVERDPGGEIDLPLSKLLEKGQILVANDNMAKLRLHTD